MFEEQGDVNLSLPKETRFGNMSDICDVINIPRHKCIFTLLYMQLLKTNMCVKQGP